MPHANDVIFVINMKTQCVLLCRLFNQIHGMGIHSPQYDTQKRINIKRLKEDF